MRYYILILLALLISCKPKNVFQDHEIIKTTKFPVSTILSGQKLDLSPEGILSFYVVDTFIIVHQQGLPEYIGIYGKESQHKLKTLLPQGRGPNEFMGFTFRGQHTKGADGTKIYFSDVNKGNLYALNITRSLEEDSLCITCISKIPYRSYPTFLTDSLFISKAYNTEKKELAFSSHDTLRNLLHIYPLYSNVNFVRYNQLGSADQIKPDLSKIATGMLMFDQINVLDLQGNHNFSITTSSEPIWKSEKYLDQHEPVIYYCDIKCTDRNVYALYINQKISEWQKVPKSVEIHVFDWNGKPQYKLKVKEYLLGMDIDEANKKLYGLATEEEMFVYNIEEYI